MAEVSADGQSIGFWADGQLKKVSVSGGAPVTLADASPGTEAQIVAQSVTTNDGTVLIPGGRGGRYVPTGHLVYGLNNVLFAVPFDVGSRQVTGGPVPLLEGVRQAG